MTRFILSSLGPLLAVTAFAPVLTASENAAHPFLLWTREEAAELRERIRSDPMAKAQLEWMSDSREFQVNSTLWHLFRYLVLEDQEAGETEKKALLGFIGRKPEPLTWEVDPKILQWNVGMPSAGDRHMRDEQTLNTLRYDVLYDELTSEERAGVETAMRSYIDYHLDGHKPWHPDFRYDRTSWLPNMHWPRAIGTNLMAVALRDEEAITAMFHSQGGWKWYFDEYLADGQFYMEEFGKYYSNIGTMLMYCEALERLDLGKYGYGYTGKNGATMKRFLRMLITVGYPRLESRPGEMARFLCVTMGDAGDTAIVTPPDDRGRGGTRWWSTAHMNGPLPKMGLPGWFEIGHRRWPEAGFDYFLAQHREPGENTYLPSLYWGLRPVDANRVSPPPVKSILAPERGFALLRAEESPAYWESPRPAVALQFARYYVHYVHDCFSILQFVAKNRLLYGRMGRPEGRRGYAGGDPWKDHVRGHCGVVVDGLKAEPVARGDDGVEGHRHRCEFTPQAKFVAVQAAGVYPDVDMERALLLTDEYLFDLFWLSSDRERTYDWQILAFGDAPDVFESWTPLSEWKGRDARRPHLFETHALAAGSRPWSATVLQPDRGPPRGVGVRLHMLGEGDTIVLGSIPPGIERGDGVSLLASRQSATSTFAALHVPFEGGPEKAAVTSFETIARADSAVVVSAVGDGVNDRICLRYGDSFDEPVTLSGNGEKFRFADYAFIRITSDTVFVTGKVEELKLRVSGSPRLVFHGIPTPASVSGGTLIYP